MSHCPNHCRTCQNETNAEQKLAASEAASIHMCRAGPLPTADLDMEDVPDLVFEDDDEDEEPYISEDVFEEGDRLFMTTIPCEAEFVRATSNISQRLAEAFHKNA